ncbi:sensor histidine kinase [Clostridium ganghwense]|uniref:histidine kinase n=1 Tax=Clostridium ganghwense TaxID=312089 RepID=A0ABT4CSD6_9CLOT|nr:HAMP domain-containing sensor histidine kinase [Clostridium ganghwense]MCY6371338.1 HAMP domain-containing sensor histidine kinase [Clostridium ganghwense]
MKSILSKLWLGITSLVLFILIIIWIFQVGFLNKFYVSERTNNLLKEGNEIVSIITKSKNPQIVSEETMSRINSTISSFNAQVIIIDSSNNVLFFNAPHNVPKRNTETIPERLLSKINIEIEKGETFIKKNTRLNDSFYFITVGIPIKENGNMNGYFILNSPLAPIKETTSILKNQLSIITLASIIIATFLSLLLAKLFTNPILKITKTSKQIANGDFTARVKLESKDEIRDLGDTINNMAVQLGQIENFRREFIANTSHELKTPISLIRAYSELIMDVDGEDKQARNEHLQVIIDESKRLNTMVEDILYLSEMEAGYYKPEFKNFSVIDTINSVIKKLSFLCSGKNININIIAANENTLISGDEAKMYQVFFNLINNAINYSHENGNIIIKVNNINDMVRIEVIDNGKGIPKEDLPYVWDRFYKVDKSHKRNNSSTGLGMAIIKNILEAHKFNYGIESELNKGTMIWIEI